MWTSTRKEKIFFFSEEIKVFAMNIIVSSQLWVGMGIVLRKETEGGNKCSGLEMFQMILE